VYAFFYSQIETFTSTNDKKNLGMWRVPDAPVVWSYIKLLVPFADQHDHPITGINKIHSVGALTREIGRGQKGWHRSHLEALDKQHIHWRFTLVMSFSPMLEDTITEKLCNHITHYIGSLVCIGTARLRIHWLQSVFIVLLNHSRIKHWNIPKLIPQWFYSFH
jgi:hypothetical protein